MKTPLEEQPLVDDTIPGDNANKPRSSQTGSVRSLVRSLVELADFGPLLLRILLDPVGSLYENIPHVLPSIFIGRKRFSPKDVNPDLTEKVILVTGGNTGLGKETVLQLAKYNPAHIYLAARTPSKGEAAAREIERAVPSTKITFLHLDLSSFGSISAAVRELTSVSSRLDILMNNAGIMATPPGSTTEGYEIQFGTNYIGHALLTRLLIPILLSTVDEHKSDVRIINISSEAHRLAPGGILFDKAKLDARGPWVRYGQSKLANILFTRELAVRYPSITSVAINPGIISTDLYGPSERTNALVRLSTATIGALTMGNVALGALNQLWAAVGHHEELVSGRYYSWKGNMSKGSKRAQDARLAQQLWDWTMEELAKHGY